MRTRDLARAALFCRPHCHLFLDLHPHRRPLHPPDLRRVFGPGGAGGKCWAPCRWRSTCCWARWACPVFAGFQGGLGALLGATGGYLIGFLLTALTVWGAERWLGRSAPVFLASCLLGLALCYLFGSVWFAGGVCRRLRPCGAGRRAGVVRVPLRPPRPGQAGPGRRPEPGGWPPPWPGARRSPVPPGHKPAPLSHIHGVRLWKGGVGYAL